MGERYFITGVQIGVILASENYPKDKGFKIVKRVMRQVEHSQFIGNIEEKDKKKYEIRIVEK
mgnify:CR=1 FL=1